MRSKIERVTIVGMGALGILYGDFFAGALGEDKVTFLADADRVARYKGARITCNGRPCHFQVQDGTLPGPEGPAQLLIFAVKATAIEAAIETARARVGRDTIILSVLNGIVSEEIIGEALGREHVLYCVAQGMDAVKLGNDLNYAHIGQLCIGIPEDEPEKEPLLQAVMELFDRTGLPYTREADIKRRMWCKWMLNVGVNQTVMVTEGTYRTVQQPGAARDMMLAAMAEVMELAKKEHIHVTREDIKSYVDLIDSLNPDGMPSMRQDGLAKRPSEVDFFAGTVLKKAEKYGLEVPVNRELYSRIKAIENYSSK